MIIGTWNLEVYPSRTSLRGVAMAKELDRHPVDVWLLTELHSDWEVAGQAICFAPSRDGALDTRRFAAIATAWTMEPIANRDDPVEAWMCLTRLINPVTSETCLALSSVLPWRGITPHWRAIWGPKVMYAEAFRHVLDYVVKRVEDERRPNEDVIWGGDFNQALAGRDYVGTSQGRADLQHAFGRLDLQAPTSPLSAMIPAHPAIDHIAVPMDWTLQDEPMVHRPIRNGRSLSDHALYLVDVRPKSELK